MITMESIGCKCGGQLWDVGRVNVCVLCGTEYTKTELKKEKKEWVIPTNSSMTWEQVQAEMKKAVPHGPDESCTCDGCTGCTGHVIGCTCDIDWDRAMELRRDYF